MSDAMNYDYPQGVTPADVWATLREVAELQKETRLQMQEAKKEAEERQAEFKKWQAETEKEAKKRQAEAEKEAKKRQAEADEETQKTKRMLQEAAEQMKKTDKQIGELTNRFGELAEHLVAPSIREKFNALGFAFGEVSRDKEIVDAQGNSVAEIDILLENGDTVMVVEVKAKPKQKEVDAHIKRMDILRRRADARNDKRTFMGAIAGAIMTNEMRAYILKTGFYAIEQTGDTVKISAPEGFKPRSW